MNDRANDRVILACFFIGIGFMLVGAYVHVTTIADIPAAEMTLRLEWSGWEWGLGTLFFLSWRGVSVTRSSETVSPNPAVNSPEFPDDCCPS